MELLKTTNPATNPYPFCFFPVYAPKFTNETFDDLNFHYRPYINGGIWTNGAWQFNHDLDVSGTSVDDGYGFPLVPFFNFFWVIQKVCNYLGYEAKGSWLTDPEVQALVMFNTVALAVKGALPVSISTKYHVWYMTIKDFMLYLKDEMAVSVRFCDSEKAIYFDYFTTIASEPVAADLSDYLLKGYKNEPINGVGYTVSFPETDDQRYSSVIVGNGQAEMSSKAKTLRMVNDNRLYGHTNYDWYLPVTEESGQSLSYFYFKMGLSIKDFPVKNDPILLSFRGMQPSKNLKSYPYGTSIGRNALQQSLGLMALQPNEPNSLFNKQIRPFLEFKDATKRISFELLLSISKASSLKMSQKISIGNADLTPMPYLIEQMTYQLPDHQGYVMAQMQAWPLLPPRNQQAIPPMIWVEIITEELVYFIDVGWFPNPNSVGFVTTNSGVASRQIKFKFWFDQAKTQPAYTSLTVYFRYIQRKHYFDNSGKEIDEQKTVAQSVTAKDQHEIMGQFSWNIFDTDLPATQITNDNEFLGIRLSLQVEPAGGYYII
jgi:hypothetical protein